MSDETTTRLYFAAHGLEIGDVNALEAAVQQAVEALAWVPTFSNNELALLGTGGLNPVAEAGADPLAETSAAFAALLKNSVNTAEAAARLGVHVSRIRQMLSGLTLYGFKVNGCWRIPCHQFTDAGLIPGIDQVNAALDRALHPVAVYRWLTHPDPDLEVAGVALSPIAWLTAGYSADPVRRIAAEL